MTRVAVLCVDDEPHVIGGLALNLRRGYEVMSAHSGAEGLEILQSKGPFAVVLSDMRMPGMDGASFLARAREVAPNTVRMMLTGQADLQSAIAAVNEGQIFRFLTKPCPANQLRLAFDAAAEQYRLITSERVLLEQTLHGCIKTLVDVLALTNPASFGSAMRVKRLITQLSQRIGLTEYWQVEVAAMLSQLGCVSLPAETAEKVQAGRPLSVQEQQMVSRVPIVTEQLLANIPRLDVVRGILSDHSRMYARAPQEAGSTEQQLIEFGGHMLRIVVDFDILETQGHDAPFAIDTMRGRPGRYDVEILEIFASLRGAGFSRHDNIREVPLSAVQVGMVFAEDVRLSNGTLLAARGYEVTASFVERAGNYRAGTLAEPLRVIVPRAPA
jgi:response regulator RpfG family c-di-GMP phosphodiesterase